MQTSLKTRDRRDGLLCVVAGVLIAAIYLLVSGEASVLSSPYLLIPLVGVLVYAFAIAPMAATKSRSPSRAIGGVLFALGALLVIFIGFILTTVLAAGRLEPSALAMLATFLWLLGGVPALLLGVLFTALARRPHRP